MSKIFNLISVSGHSRELDYQHKETPNTGAFSAFGDSDESGSTWLTAFVVKSFVQASPYIYINIPKVEEALNWMLGQQDGGGAFKEPGRVLHSGMQVLYRVSLKKHLPTNGVPSNKFCFKEVSYVHII